MNRNEGKLRQFGSRISKLGDERVGAAPEHRRDLRPASEIHRLVEQPQWRQVPYAVKDATAETSA